MLKLKNIVIRLVRHVSTSKPDKSPFRSLPTLVFGKYLFATNTISSGVLMLAGDLCQQEIEYRQHKLVERYDYWRLTRMFIVGLGLGPPHHYYYLYIARIMPKRDLLTVTKKILLDQLIMSPICIAAFFYSLGAMERKSMVQATSELKDKIVEVYVMDWLVWPPTQFINFYFLPVKYQVLYINGVTTLYNIFLSYIKHRELAEENAKKLVLLESKKS